MTNAVLFDLDNTLVLYDEPAFLHDYFTALAEVFADLVPPESLAERVLMSTVALSGNDGTLNNADYFMNTFLDPSADRSVVWDRFLTFYQTDYLELKPDCRPPDGLDDVLSKTRDRKRKRVLATNPIYPRAAYAHRLSWIGLSLDDFDLVTDIENTRFVKPNAGYFRSITESVGVPPESCLMVGNDPAYDVAAAQIGIRTYLTTDAEASDYILPGISSDQHTAPTPDIEGPFANLIHHL